MILIISTVVPTIAHAVHIPDADGNPVCQIPLNRLTWVLADVDPQWYRICPDCLRILEQQRADQRERSAGA